MEKIDISIYIYIYIYELFKIISETLCGGHFDPENKKAKLKIKHRKGWI
jgi:hypothetical protein